MLVTSTDVAVTDKEGTCLDFLVPSPPFLLAGKKKKKTLEKVFKHFKFIREHLVLL